MVTRRPGCASPKPRPACSPRYPQKSSVLKPPVAGFSTVHVPGRGQAGNFWGNVTEVTPLCSKIQECTTVDVTFVLSQGFGESGMLGAGLGWWHKRFLLVCTPLHLLRGLCNLGTEYDACELPWGLLCCCLAEGRLSHSFQKWWQRIRNKWGNKH